MLYYRLTMKNYEKVCCYSIIMKSMEFSFTMEKYGSIPKLKNYNKLQLNYYCTLNVKLTVVLFCYGGDVKS